MHLLRNLCFWKIFILYFVLLAICGAISLFAFQVFSLMYCRGSQPFLVKTPKIIIFELGTPSKSLFLYNTDLL